MVRSSLGIAMFAHSTGKRTPAGRLEASSPQRSLPAKRPCSGAGAHLFTLHRSIGNQAIARLFVQPKLAVGPVDDPLERDADRAAAQVMRMPDPGVLQRKCATCDEEEKKEPPKVARAASRGGQAFDGAPAPAIVHEALRSPGQPLEPAMRAFFEPRFGQDFSGVRVHADALAAKSAEAVGALAYTVGENIVFGNNQYSQHSGSGRRLLAHELAHTIQQGGSNRHSIQRQPKPAEDRPVNKPAEGPHQQLFVVRDKGLKLGGVLVSDLADLKRKLMATKIAGEWTLVLSIHGSEDRMAAQAPPKWQENAIFYEAADIDQLFGNDKDFAKWRDQYGPSYLSLVSCQVSKSFEGTLIKNLNRAGTSQPSRGLGAGCKPIATAQTVGGAPATRAAYERLPSTQKDAILDKLRALNKEWGYYGAPPVPDDQILHYYYDEEPKGEWVTVEVMVGTGHDIASLQQTGIAFWNRTFGPKAAQFREFCSQGVGGLHGRTPGVPP